MSLQNKTILITRQPDQAGSLITEVEARGGRAVVVPMIRVVPPDSWDGCDEAIGRLDEYAALIVTSANAAEKFFGRCDSLGVPVSVLQKARMFAVGSVTAERIRARGLSVEAVPDRFSGADLAGLLSRMDLQGRKVLMPRGDIARLEVARTLRENGVSVDDVVVYRTQGPDPEQAHSVARRLQEHEFDVVTFASPSAVDNFAGSLPGGFFRELPRYAAIAVIGPTTRNAVEAQGIKAGIIADQSTAHGLVDAIDKYFRNNIGIS